jgi:elongation factor Ts
MVKALREETGQGMMECKKALEETGGNVEAAKDLLRTRGQLKAEKKAARTTSEGLIQIVVSEDKKSATMVEVDCETDFCARNDVFIAMVDRVAQLASRQPPGPTQADDAIKSAVQEAFNKISENMSFVRGIRLAGDQVGAYRHHNSKVGVLVAVQGIVDPVVLSEVCMHIAFHAPLGIVREDVPKDVIDREKAIAKAQAVEQGKPEQIAEKMVVGKINKFYQDNCLMEQPFVKDPEKTVKQVLGAAKVTAFARYQVGESKVMGQAD